MASKNKVLNQSSYGERVKLVIALTNSKNQAFCRLSNFSNSTLKSWIHEEANPTPRLLKRFLNALEKQSVYCSSSWLLTGEGKAPHRIQDFEKPFNAHFISPKISLEKQGILETHLQKEIDLYYSHGKSRPQEFKVFRVGDGGMEPYYSSQDIVGCYFSFTKGLKDLQGKVCVIELEKGHFTVRKLVEEENHFLLVSANKDVAVEKISHFKRAGEIHWHRKVK